MDKFMQDEVMGAFKVLQALKHPERLRIVNALLAEGGELNVTELFIAARLPDKAVGSRHLRVLRNAKVVNPPRREGWFQYYSVNHDLLEMAQRFLEEMNQQNKKS